MPRLQPDAILLISAATLEAGQARLEVVVPDLPGIDIRAAGDGWHAVWRVNSIDHQMWFKAPPSPTATTYAAVIPLDELFQLRSDAAHRLWRVINGQRADRALYPLPQHTRRRLILTLRAVDARKAGASYRTIAEVLLGFSGKTKADFEQDARKNMARRLVADGLTYVRGGWRNLLLYPLRMLHRDR